MGNLSILWKAKAMRKVIEFLVMLPLFLVIIAAFSLLIKNGIDAYHKGIYDIFIYVMSIWVSISIFGLMAMGNREN